MYVFCWRSRFLFIAISSTDEWNYPNCQLSSGAWGRKASPRSFHLDPSPTIETRKNIPNEKMKMHQSQRVSLDKYIIIYYVFWKTTDAATRHEKREVFEGTTRTYLYVFDSHAIRYSQSAIRNRQSTIRNPRSHLRNTRIICTMLYSDVFIL